MRDSQPLVLVQSTGMQRSSFQACGVLLFWQCCDVCARAAAQQRAVIARSYRV